MGATWLPIATLAIMATSVGLCSDAQVDLRYRVAVSQTDPNKPEAQPKLPATSGRKPHLAAPVASRKGTSFCCAKDCSKRATFVATESVGGVAAMQYYCAEHRPEGASPKARPGPAVRRAAWAGGRIQQWPCCAATD
jgi:hypothetical protein